VAKSSPKFPAVAKLGEKFPKAAKSSPKFPAVAKLGEKFPKAAKLGEKFPKAAKLGGKCSLSENAAVTLWLVAHRGETWRKVPQTGVKGSSSEGIFPQWDDRGTIGL
jgi:hypothetical protein